MENWPIGEITEYSSPVVLFAVGIEQLLSVQVWLILVFSVEVGCDEDFD